jgi:hypothetical protein
MRPLSRLAGNQNYGAIFKHLKLDMTLIWSTLVKSKYLFHPTFYQAVLFAGKFHGIQRGGTDGATIDHSDIRGLGTA